jgi:hypothetical protein
MRRNLWGNADSADNERKGLLPSAEIIRYNTGVCSRVFWTYSRVEETHRAHNTEAERRANDDYRGD